MESCDRYSSILCKLGTGKKPKILVVGDIILDRYLVGKAKGLSPEGSFPLIVMNDDYEDFRLGGASNCCNNIKKLMPNIHVDLCGMVGSDLYGVKVREMLSKSCIGFEDTIMYTDKHPTILKSRVCDGNRQIVRFDIEHQNNVGKSDQVKMIKLLSSVAKNYDVIIVSDYGKGVVSDKLIPTLRLNSQAFIIVDPKKKDFKSYRTVNMITPNKKEIEDALKIDITSIDESIAACKKLQEMYGIDNIVNTLSEHGMVWVGKNSVRHFKSSVRQISDVCGAGDTVVATIAVMLSYKVNIEDSIFLANIAAGIGVEKFGTSTVSLDEIKERTTCRDLMQKM